MILLQIIFQILIAILILPLTILLFLIFNIYRANWLGIIFISIFISFYAMLCGIVIHSWNAIAWIFVVLLILYICRSIYLRNHFRTKNIKDYPVIKSKIRITNWLQLNFNLALSFLKLVQWLPKFINQELSKVIGVNIGMVQLLESLLEHSRGTQIKMNYEGKFFDFEIE